MFRVPDPDPNKLCDVVAEHWIAAAVHTNEVGEVFVEKDGLVSAFTLEVDSSGYFQRTFGLAAMSIMQTERTYSR